MASQARMSVDFLLHAGASPQSPSTASELSDLSPPHFQQSPPSSSTNSETNSNPAIGMIELANVAAMAPAMDTRVPYSPVSSNSTAASVEEQIDRLHLRAAQQVRSVQQATSQARSRQNTCPKCNATFNQKIRFLHHLIAVHDIRTYESRPILPCAKCESAFLRNTDRSKHDACVHQRLRPFACDAPNCSSSFFFAKDLSKHKSTVHLRFKPFPCTICKKAFGKREHMTSHVKRVHQKLRPFKCDVCGIRLASKYNLQGHLKTAAHAAAQTLANREGARS